MKALQSILIAYSLTLALTTTALAVEIKGVRFADRLAMESTELRLTGVAVLKWAMLFDVYAGGFYLPDGHAPESWTDDVAKHLELSYFRDIPGKGFADASIELLKKNLAAQNYEIIEERLLSFCALFQDVKPGDRYSITYRPEVGTELRLNGELLGASPGADFAAAYFGIWLGDKPISSGFRDRLLGNESV